jgi:hypothetical protein
MKFSFALLASLLALTLSCQDDPADKLTDDPITAGDTTHLVPPRYLSLDQLTAWFGQEYGIHFILQFEEDDYMTVSEGVPLDYTSASDTSRIKRLLYYIGDYVLNVFPARTVAKYMPPTIYLVDSLKSRFGVWDELTTPGKVVKDTVYYPIAGQCTGSYLVIGNAGPRFDDKKEGLREELLSLFVERMLYNTTLPALDAFQKFSEDATTATGATWEITSNGIVLQVPSNYPYWDGLAGTSSLTTRSSGSTWSGDNDGKTLWLGRGIRKVGHAGCIYREYRNLVGINIDSYSFVKATLKQDFADFVAFLVTTPPAQREAFYAQVDANKRCNLASLTDDMRTGEKPIPDYYYQPLPDTTWFDARFPYAGTLGANAMRQKDAYVKTYAKDNLQLNLE